MNRITIDRRVYDLGKLTSRSLTRQQWEDAKVHLRRDDKAHVTRIGDDFYFVVQAKLDPKYDRVDLYYRTMTLAFVMPERTRDDSDDDRPSIRRIRGAGGEL